jgi:hypothetical protein
MIRSTRLCAFALSIGTLAANGACAAGALPEVAIYHVVDLGRAARGALAAAAPPSSRRAHGHQ